MPFPKLLSVIFVAAVLFALSASAQESRGSITGRVTDFSGSAIPNASVTATEESTNVAVTGISNEQGNYQILFLRPGRYSVSTTVAGFKTFQRGGIEVRIGERIGLDIRLDVGDVTEKLVVTAETPLLETATANVGQVVDSRRVQELPTMHGSVRSLFYQFAGAALAGGAYASAPKFQDPSRPASSSWLSFNGAPAGTTEFALDGVPNTQTANADLGSGMSNQPPADSIQELKLETSYDASVGHTSGTHISIVTKSGTNAPHGTAYFFYRDPAFNANTFFGNAARQPRAEFNYKRGGASLNGPVYIPKVYDGRNRTFFAYTYEIMDEASQGYPFIGSVPPVDHRKGDFSALLGLGPQYQIYDPMTTAPAANGRYTRQPFPNNVIPADRINPIALKMAEYWPSPNVPGLADGANNYALQNLPAPNFYQDHIARIDHVLNEKHRLYARYAQYFKTEGPYRDYFQNITTGKYFRARPFNIVVDDTYTPSPTLVIDMRYGYQRFGARNWSPSQGFDLATLGFSQAVIDQLSYRHPVATMFPGVNVSGLQGLQPEGTSGQVGDDIHSWMVDLNRPTGNHFLKFGGEFRTYRKNNYDFGNGTPRFVFGSSYTNGPLDNSPTAPAGIGQGFAAFLLGIPNSGMVDYNDSYAVQSTYGGAYLQDNWRVTSRLTLTMGLRWEFLGAMTERFNRSVRGFDPTAQLPIAEAVRANYSASPIPEISASQFDVRGGLLFAGAGGQPRGLYPAQKRNLMPRVGFSFNPFQNTVLRGGYGFYYLDTGITSRVGPFQPGYSQQTLIIPTLDNGLTYQATLSNPFPDGIQAPAGSNQGAMTFLGRPITFYDSDLNSPYLQRWNLNIQQLLPGSFLVEAGYAGSRATAMRINKNYNGLPNSYLSTLPYRDQPVIDRLTAQVANPFYPLLPGTSLAGRNVSVSQLLLPFPQFTSVATTTNQGYSWYHSMQVRAERRFSNGFSAQLTYTFSKQMEALTYLNADDPMPYRTISPNDRPHHTGLTLLYELPFGRRKPLLANGPRPLLAVISGWQVSSIMNQWSGTPLSFGDVILKGGIKDIPLSGSERSLNRWFNTSVFETAPARQLGSHLFQGPLYYSGVRSDGVHQWDFSLLKYTTLSEGVRLQIRADAFNAFNHPEFTPPNTSVTSSAFGTVTGETAFTRQLQFAVKLIF